MTRLALLLLAAVAGCVPPSKHPHGAPPGQVKKALYRCDTCGATKDIADLCHGKIMIPIP